MTAVVPVHISDEIDLWLDKVIEMEPCLEPDRAEIRAGIVKCWLDHGHINVEISYSSRIDPFKGTRKIEDLTFTHTLEVKPK